MSNKFEKELTVRGYHLDLYQHVNHARYLEFLEEARWSMIEESGSYDSIAKMQIGFVIVNININYKHSAVVGDKLIINSALARFGTKSLTVHQDIYLKGTEKHVLESDVTMVIVDMKTGKPIVINDDVKALFKS